MEFVRLSHKNGNCSPTKQLAVFLSRCYTKIDNKQWSKQRHFSFQNKNAGLLGVLTYLTNPRGCKQTTGTLRFRKHKTGKVVGISLYDLHILKLNESEYLLTRLRCFCHLTASLTAKKILVILTLKRKGWM